MFEFYRFLHVHGAALPRLRQGQSWENANG